MSKSLDELKSDIEEMEKQLAKQRSSIVRCVQQVCVMLWKLER